MTTKQQAVVVTGASQGIDAAITNLCLERRYNVVTKVQVTSYGLRPYR